MLVIRFQKMRYYATKWWDGSAIIESEGDEGIAAETLDCFETVGAYHRELQWRSVQLL